MSTACGRPQGDSGPCGRMWTGEEEVKTWLFVLNGGPQWHQL